MEWLALAVAILVALTAAFGSYLTARKTVRVQARRELLATKRRDYVEAFSSLSSALVRIMNAKNLTVTGSDGSAIVDVPRMNEEMARGFQDSARAITTIEILGTPEMRAVLKEFDGIEHAVQFQFWFQRTRDEIARLMVEDLERAERELQRW